MYNTLEVALIAAVALLIGAGAAYLLLRWRSPAAGGDAELRQLREEHEQYRHEVTTHFSKTAEMLGQLAGSYREVHNHLAQGAQALCEPGAARSLRTLPDDIGEAQPARHEMLEPPRDYAPNTENAFPDTPFAAPRGTDERRDSQPRAYIEPPRF